MAELTQREIHTYTRAIVRREKDSPNLYSSLTSLAPAFDGDMMALALWISLPFSLHDEAPDPESVGIETFNNWAERNRDPELWQILMNAFKAEMFSGPDSPDVLRN